MSEEGEEHRYNEISLWKCCVGWNQAGEEKKVDLKLRVLIVSCSDSTKGRQS